MHCTKEKIINKTDRASAPMELTLTRKTDQQISNDVNNYVAHVVSALKEKHSMQRENEGGEITPSIGYNCKGADS